MTRLTHFRNPEGLNNYTASTHPPSERFCMLGWHWKLDFRDDVIMTIIERPLGRDTQIQACQSCMRHWHATDRVFVGTLSGVALLREYSFRPKHLKRIDRWIRNNARWMRQIKETP
jgi:hypothetical protein